MTWSSNAGTATDRYESEPVDTGTTAAASSNTTSVGWCEYQPVAPAREVYFRINYEPGNFQAVPPESLAPPLKVINLSERSIEKFIKILRTLRGIERVDLVTEPKKFIGVVTKRLKVKDLDWENVYTIHISTNPVKTIKVKGENNKGTCCHPHIRADSMPCWGSTKKDINRFLQQGKVLSLVGLLVRFLECYNPDGAYSDFKQGEDMDEEPRPRLAVDDSEGNGRL